MVATVLGLRQAADVSVADALAAHLARQQMLLVLDNCEHVLDAVAQLSARRCCCPPTTSGSWPPAGNRSACPRRRATGCPLTLPAPDAPRWGTGQAEAVTLFVQRARQIDPDLTFDGDSGAMLERLVRRLDGMPLAIELAAARVEVLGVAQLLDRLDDRFRVLVSANRGAGPSAVARSGRRLELSAAQRAGAARLPGTCRIPRTVHSGRRRGSGRPGRRGGRTALGRLLAAGRRRGLARTAGPATRCWRRCAGCRAMGRLRQTGEERQASSALAAHALQVAERAATQMDPAPRAGTASRAMAGRRGRRPAPRAHVGTGPRSARRAPPCPGAGTVVAGARPVGAGVCPAAPRSHPGGPRRRQLAHRQPLARPYCVRRDQLRCDRGGATTARWWTPSRDGAPSADLVDGLTGRCRPLRNMGRLAEAEADARAALDLALQLGYTAGKADALKELSIIFTYADDGEHAV